MNFRRVLSGLILTAAAVWAQPTVAPTPERVGNARGADHDGYNIVQSYELGYRFHTVHGDQGKYRSDVNYGNGVRLLGSNLTIHSKEGLGRFFDEIVLTTQGLGNDPYQNAMFRIQRNRLYRYELNWRQQQYYNPALYVSNARHFMDTSRALQNHDLIFLPQSRIKFFAGYSRNSQSGPSLSTIHLFQNHQQGDEFAFLADVRRKQDEYRIGGEFELFGTRLHWLRSWEFFKEDTPYSLTTPSAGNNTIDRTVLNSFRRDEPYHGSTSAWRVSLARDGGLLAMTGRFTHAATERDFIQDERSSGVDRLGIARTRQILVFGTGRRPVTAANLTLSLLPKSRFVLSNHTAFHQTRMEGDGSYSELNTASLALEFLRFQFLGIRTFTNSTLLDVHVAPWLGFYGGYQFSNRRIWSTQQETFVGDTTTARGDYENQQHTGVLGARLRASSRLSLNLEAEIGRADRPVFPTSERKYHVLGARLQYKTKPLLFSVFSRANYNTNSASVTTSHSSRSRASGADLSWTARPWLFIDAGYSHQHLDTLTGIAFFISPQLVRGNSIYLSNVHAINTGVRFSVGRRADFYFGYSRTQDTADRADPSQTVPVQTNPARVQAASIFATATAFPLTYDSPQARLSIPLHLKLRFNVGYQFYRYKEEIPIYVLQNYRAHTGFTSLLWTF